MLNHAEHWLKMTFTLVRRGDGRRRTPAARLEGKRIDDPHCRDATEDGHRQWYTSRLTDDGREGDVPSHRITLRASGLVSRLHRRTGGFIDVPASLRPLRPFRCEPFPTLGCFTFIPACFSRAGANLRRRTNPASDHVETPALTVSFLQLPWYRQSATGRLPFAAILKGGGTSSAVFRGDANRRTSRRQLSRR